jgi:hypothetical protein
MGVLRRTHSILLLCSVISVHVLICAHVARVRLHISLQLARKAVPSQQKGYAALPILSIRKWKLNHDA